MTGVSQVTLWAAYLVLLTLTLIGFMLRKNGVNSTVTWISGLVIMASLLGATIASPSSTYAWGGLLPYLAMAVLFCTSVRDMSIGNRFNVLLIVANIVNIALGLGLIFHNRAVGDFILKYYAWGTELVPFEVEVGKPILTFGTHSLGAFFYYFFFLLNFEAFRTYKRWYSLAFAISYILLTAALLSVTGFLLMPVALFQLVAYAITHMRTRALLASALVAGMLGWALYSYVSQMEEWDTVTRLASDVFSSQTSGFAGRYQEFGTLYSTLHYLRQHPFRPVGITQRADLFFGDSGFIEYYLRGSVLLLGAVYLGLFGFLRQNLVSKRHFLIIFGVMLAFELGYASVTYLRTLYLLPVMVVYLNDLSRASRSVPSAMSAA
jgi:hypothetical protein